MVLNDRLSILCVMHLSFCTLELVLGQLTKSSMSLTCLCAMSEQ